MPVGCIPEKIIRGDSDFVETFRDDGSRSLYAAHPLPARPLLPKRRRGVRKLSGKWTRRICDVFWNQHADADGGPEVRTTDYRHSKLCQRDLRLVARRFYCNGCWPFNILDSRSDVEVKQYRIRLR
jgi:hypothetical protein